MTRQFLSVTKGPYYQLHVCDEHEKCDSYITKMISEPNHMSAIRCIYRRRNTTNYQGTLVQSKPNKPYKLLSLFTLWQQRQFSLFKMSLGLQWGGGVDLSRGGRWVSIWGGVLGRPPRN